MIFTTKQLFSLTDGRISTNMDDIYSMLNAALGASLMTTQLPMALDYVKEKNPIWYKEASEQLTAIKKEAGTNNFKLLMEYIDKNYSESGFDVTKC